MGRKYPDEAPYHEVFAHWNKAEGEFTPGLHTGRFREHGHYTHNVPRGTTREEFNKSVQEAYGRNTMIRVIYGLEDSDIITTCGVLHAAHT